MNSGLISPEQIDAILGVEKAPLWMYGQNICHLRDMTTEHIAAERRTVLHLIREAYRMGILVYDNRGIWSLNSNFGDVIDWIRRRQQIIDVIREAGETGQKMDMGE